MNFSAVLKAELKGRNITVVEFARQIGFSHQYVYDLLRGRGNRRWNEESINKACDILGLQIEFKRSE